MQLKHNYVFESFITASPVPFNLPNHFDWIFFNSPNAVRWFYNNKQSEKIQSKIAALSAGTAEELTKLDVEIDFIGHGAVEDIAHLFLKELKNDERVLFPLSNISKKSIPNLLPTHQIHCVTVYQTNIIPKPIKPCDVVLFTSPSNVQGYLVNNSLPKQCVAIGETTNQYLNKLGAKVVQLSSYHSNSWIPFLEASIS